jgi:hypothetical protein
MNMKWIEIMVDLEYSLCHGMEPPRLSVVFLKTLFERMLCHERRGEGLLKVKDYNMLMFQKNIATRVPVCTSWEEGWASFFVKMLCVYRDYV